MRYLAKVAYDGTNFCGWQIQKQDRTVQGEIEKAISRIVKHEVPIIGSGRTDAGVHALGQYFHFDLEAGMTPRQLMLAIQSKLNCEIQIKEIFTVTDDFHARFKACQRTYLYVIARTRTPFNRFYKTWFPARRIIFKKLEDCLPYFVGEHDFVSFSKFNPQIKSTICKINSFSFRENTEDIILEISADRFLHNMVRRIVGTMINISHTNVDPQIINDLMEAKSPENKLISTAPAEGLYLLDVDYPSEYFI